MLSRAHLASTSTCTQYGIANSTLFYNSHRICVSKVLCRSQLVLLNVSDHHTRAKANLQDASLPPPRVLGCLLGQQAGRVVDVSNSFEFVYESTASGLVIDEGLLTKKTEQCKLLQSVATDARSNMQPHALIRSAYQRR